MNKSDYAYVVALDLLTRERKSALLGSTPDRELAARAEAQRIAVETMRDSGAEYDHSIIKRLAPMLTGNYR